MVAFSLRFVTGRFHATPWGRHVNEGAVEWPPSPWRILRALVAVWHLKGRELASRETMASLLEMLSGQPRFYLPPATMAHTRHYMPIREGSGSTKIFDAFVRMGNEDAVIVAWPDTILTPEQSQLLDALLDRLTYLGRAEAWVEASRLQESSWDFNVAPTSGREEDGESVPLLATMPPEAFAAWREQQIARGKDKLLSEKREKAQSSGKEAHAVKLGPKDLQKLEANLPSDLLDCLERSTSELRKAGWSQPPGSRWVSYSVPAKCLAPLHTERPSAVARQVTVARFAVASAVRPRLLDAVSLAERVRMALMAQFKDDPAGVPPVLSGKRPEGTPLDAGHAHLHVLMESNEGDGRISHVTLHAPMGFDPGTRAALSRIRKVWGHGGHDVQLALIGTGDASDFGGSRLERGESPCLDASRVWESSTPFVLMRHPKRHRNGRPKLRENGEQIDGPEDQIRLELQRRGWPDPITIERLPHVLLGSKPVRWGEFRRERHHGSGRHASMTAMGFRLIFAESVRGPLALGYGSHFGLGCFIAVH